MALCQCGCGDETKPYTENNPARGMVKGEPAKFIKGHKLRQRPTMDGILRDIREALAKSVSAEHPDGDLRQSSYFGGLGHFSRNAFYNVFTSWEEAILHIFPDGVEGLRVVTKMHHVMLKTELKWATRTCLAHNCGVEFWSWGPENRRCEKCRTQVSFMDADDVETYEICLPNTRGTYV